MNILQRITNKMAVRLNIPLQISPYILGGMIFLLTNWDCFGQMQRGISIEKARESILSEQINDAVISYAMVAKNSTDASLVAEYAYALALGGIYDAALVQLDRLWVIGHESAEANYFTAQVFALIGYNDLAEEWWKEGPKNKLPGWIKSKQAALFEKYKHQEGTPPLLSTEEIKADFNRANELASQNAFFQALALFRKIIDACPNEFLPYVGYSITLEKAGAIEKSLQALEKGITLVPDDTEYKQTKQLFEQRSLSLRQKLTSLPATTASHFQQPAVKTDNGSQMMAFAGGMITSSYTNFNCRYGYFVSGKSNGSLDFGVTTSAGASSSNVGLSFYSRERVFVYGMGLVSTFQQGASTFYYKVSVGLSFMNKKRNASYDIFLDANQGLKKATLTVINLSLGRSIYFGKRK